MRPILALAACEAAPARARARRCRSACAIELVHAYSLVHDDLPAMDDDELRRGRPTVHVVYGEALAILAGDALLTEAFRVAAAGARDAGIDPARALERRSRRSPRAAGAAGMVGGQVADLEAEGVVADRALVESIHRRKTGGVDRRRGRCRRRRGRRRRATRRAALAEYGRALGLAFQVADDILDATAPTAVTGKRVGGDAAARQGDVSRPCSGSTARAPSRAISWRAVSPRPTLLGAPAEPLRAIATLRGRARLLTPAARERWRAEHGEGTRRQAARSIAASPTRASARSAW